MISAVDAVKSSGILKAKQKLGVTFNSDKLGGIDFTKFSKSYARKCQKGVKSPILASIRCVPAVCTANVLYVVFTDVCLRPKSTNNTK